MINQTYAITDRIERAFRESPGIEPEVAQYGARDRPDHSAVCLVARAGNPDDPAGVALRLQAGACSIDVAPGRQTAVGHTGLFIRDIEHLLFLEPQAFDLARRAAFDLAARLETAGGGGSGFPPTSAL